MVVNPILSVRFDPVGNTLPDRNRTAIDSEVSSRLAIYVEIISIFSFFLVIDLIFSHVLTNSEK
jgi:hypothetical protein